MVRPFGAASAEPPAGPDVAFAERADAVFDVLGEEAMPEFRIEKDTLKHEARLRLLSWGTVLLLLAVGTSLLILHASGYIGGGSDLGSVVMLTMLGAAIIAIILAPREGLRRAERKMVFAVDDSRIIRKRPGYPDVVIAFSEVDTLREELGCLVITSTEPRRKIAIPRRVGGYEQIRTELAKHHALSAPAAFPIRSALVPGVCILSWVAVVWFRDTRVVMLAGSIGFITLALGSRRLWVVSQRSLRRPLLWIFLGSAWLAALVLIYLRVVRR